MGDVIFEECCISGSSQAYAHTILLIFFRGRNEEDRKVPPAISVPAVYGKGGAAASLGGNSLNETRNINQNKDQVPLEVLDIGAS